MLIKTSAMLSADWLTCAYLFLEGDYWWVLDVLVASWAASRLFLYDVATSDGFRLFSAFRLSCCIISLHLSLTSAWRLDLHWDFCYSLAALFFLGWLTDSELWSISLDVCIWGSPSIWRYVSFLPMSMFEIWFFFLSIFSYIESNCFFVLWIW